MKECKATTQKINETKKCVSEQINKIDEPLTKPMKKKETGTKYSKNN